MLLSSKVQCNILMTEQILVLKGIWGTLKMVKLNWLLFVTHFSKTNLFFVFSPLFNQWKIFFILNLVGVSYCWIFQLSLKGLGFKAFYSKIADKFRIDLGYSHIFQLNQVVSKSLFIYNKRLYSKKIILFASISHTLLYDIVFKLLKLRIQGRYKTHGFNVQKIFLTPILKRKIRKKSYR